MLSFLISACLPAYLRPHHVVPHDRQRDPAQAALQDALHVRTCEADTRRVEVLEAAGASITPQGVKGEPGWSSIWPPAAGDSHLTAVHSAAKEHSITSSCAGPIAMAPSGSSHACRSSDLVLEFRLDAPEGVSAPNLYPLSSRALCLDMHQFIAHTLCSSRRMRLEPARVPHSFLAARYSGRLCPGAQVQNPLQIKS